MLSWLLLLHLLMLPNDSDLLDLVPKDARLVVSVKDLNKAKDAFQKSAVYSFINDPLVKEMMSDNLGDLRKSFDYEDKLLGDDAEDIKDSNALVKTLSPFRLFESVSGHMVFYSKAFFHVELDFESVLRIPIPREKTELPYPQANLVAAVAKRILAGDNYKDLDFAYKDFTILINPREERDKALEHLSSIKECLYHENKRFVNSSEDYCDQNLEVFEFTHNKGESGSAIFGEVGDLIFITINKHSDQALTEAYGLIDKILKEDENGTILGNDAFSNGREKVCGAEKNVEVFYDATMYSEEVLPHKPFYVRPFANSILSVSLAGDLCNKKGLDLSAYISMKKSGLINCFDEFSNLEFAKLTPGNAFSMVTVDVNLEEFGKHLKKEFKIEKDLLSVYVNVDVYTGRIAYLEMDASGDESAPAKGSGQMPVKQTGWLFLAEMKGEPITVDQFGFDQMDGYKITYEMFQGHRILVIHYYKKNKYYVTISNQLLAMSRYPSVIRAYLRLSDDSGNALCQSQKVKELCKNQPDSICLLLGRVGEMVKERFHEYNHRFDTVVHPDGSNKTDKLIELTAIEKNVYEAVDKHFKGFLGLFVSNEDQGLMIQLRNE